LKQYKDWGNWVELGAKGQSKGWETRNQECQKVQPASGSARAIGAEESDFKQFHLGIAVLDWLY
jgi:hypothetical protein